MLPALREELILHKGPLAADGAPTWSLQDPVRNLFFRIDWLTFEILSRWNLDDPAVILEAVDRETTIEPDKSDVDAVVRFLSEHELIQRHHADGTGWYRERARSRRTSAGHWLLEHYLFFRIPLLRPDDWLARSQRWVNAFYTQGFLILTAFALLAGLIQVSRQWDGFVTTLTDSVSWHGLAGFFTALIFVKFLHELGHAFTAKRYGCRVPTIGVAFLVLFPMAYTDVTEVWKLADKRQRLAVGAAGVLTELSVAAWATLAWTLLPDGSLRSAVFLLATTTWISTVIVNASPFLRFDGYFVLMDWLDMPNLHQRSFALAKWQLRRALFGLREEAPEAFTRQRHRALVLFACITWTYRLLVFGGIAVLVYALFPKPLGPVLAAVELAWFIVMPIWREVKAWRMRLPAIVASRRSRFTLMWLGMALLVVFVPWDQRISAQGLLRPIEHMPIVSPGAARITALPIADGQRVTRGQTLIELDSPEIRFQQQAVAARADILRWQTRAAGVDPALREKQGVTEAARGKAGAELAGFEDEAARHRRSAAFAGHIYLSDPDLQVGSWLGKNQPIGVLSDTSRWVVDTYLPESELGRIEVGNTGNFYSEAPGAAEVSVRVERIDRDATRALPHGILASTRGGKLLVREKGRQWVPETALYRVTLSLEQNHAPDRPQILRGDVVLHARPKAWADEFTRKIASLVVREAGF